MRVRSKPNSQSVVSTAGYQAKSVVVSATTDPASVLDVDYVVTVDKTVSVDSTHTCADEITVGYFKSVRNGDLLPVHPLAISKPDYNVDITAKIKLRYDVPSYKTDGTISSWTCRRGAWQCNGLSGNIVLPSIPTHTFDEDRMLVEALANMRSELWDVGTFLAEINKTASMVANARASALERVEKILSVLAKRHHRKKFRTFDELFSEFSSMWMEARYGWRILYYDILSAQEAYQRLTEGLSTIRRRWTVTEDSQQEAYSPWSQMKVGTTRYPFMWRWYTNALHVGRAGCGGHIDLNAPVSVDPVITVWEVIPFTMVSDWFVNIGDNLRAFSPMGTGKLDYAFYSQTTSGYHTLEVRQDPTFTFQGSIGYEVSDYQVSTSSTILAFEEKMRRPATPTFHLAFDPNLGNLRWLDGIALSWLLRKRLFSILKLTKL